MLDYEKRMRVARRLLWNASLQVLGSDKARALRAEGWVNLARRFFIGRTVTGVGKSFFPFMSAIYDWHRFRRYFWSPVAAHVGYDGEAFLLRSAAVLRGASFDIVRGGPFCAASSSLLTGGTPARAVSSPEGAADMFEARCRLGVRPHKKFARVSSELVSAAVPVVSREFPRLRGARVLRALAELAVAASIDAAYVDWLADRLGLTDRTPLVGGVNRAVLDFMRPAIERALGGVVATPPDNCMPAWMHRLKPWLVPDDMRAASGVWHEGLLLGYVEPSIRLWLSPFYLRGFAERHVVRAVLEAGDATPVHEVIEQQEELLGRPVIDATLVACYLQFTRPTASDPVPAEAVARAIQHRRPRVWSYIERGPYVMGADLAFSPLRRDATDAPVEDVETVY